MSMILEQDAVPVAVAAATASITTETEILIDPSQLADDAEPGKILRMGSVISEIANQKKGYSKLKMTAERIIGINADKKYFQKRNAQIQIILDRLEGLSTIDLQDDETTQVTHIRLCLHRVDWLIRREIRFLEKFLRQVRVFSQAEDLMSSTQIWNRLIESLRCVFVRKHEHLFSYGDRGDEYFILLKGNQIMLCFTQELQFDFHLGKAYCLVPAMNLVPLEDQSAIRVVANVVEDAADEEYLHTNYPRSQCVKIYQPGQTFGEIALLTNESLRMASIVCKEDSYFISLDREGYDSILGSYQKHIMNERMHFLKSFAMFKSIPNNKILSFLHESHEESYQLGQPIYSQGEKPTKIYFLLSGEVQLTVDFSVKQQQSMQKQQQQQQQQQQQHLQSSVQQPPPHAAKFAAFFSPNLRTVQHRKTLVRIPTNTYFGDEDMRVRSSMHSYTATSLSESTRTIEIDIRVLSQFLKVYGVYDFLVNTAKEKENYYKDILEADPKYAEAIQTKQNRLLKSKNNCNAAEVFKSSSASATVLPLINSPPQQPSSCKFNNVYHAVSNENMRAKNYMSINNAYNNTCTFTIADVPMTTTMNRDQDELKRLRFRLAKSISTSQSHQMNHHHHPHNLTNQQQTLTTSQIMNTASTIPSNHTQIESTVFPTTTFEEATIKPVKKPQRVVQIANKNGLSGPPSITALISSEIDVNQDYQLDKQASSQSNIALYKKAAIKNISVSATVSPKAQFIHPIGINENRRYSLMKDDQVQQNFASMQLLSSTRISKKTLKLQSTFDHIDQNDFYEQPRRPEKKSITSSTNSLIGMSLAARASISGNEYQEMLLNRRKLKNILNSQQESMNRVSAMQSKTSPRLPLV